jgi:hypothetical protein
VIGNILFWRFGDIRIGYISFDIYYISFDIYYISFRGPARGLVFARPLLNEAVWEPDTAAGRACSLVSCHCKWLQSARVQFEKLPLQLGSSVRIHAVCQFENLLFVDESNKVTHAIFSQKRPKIILDDNIFKMRPIAGHRSTDWAIKNWNPSAPHHS